MKQEMDVPAVCGKCGGSALIRGAVRYCIACSKITVECTCKTKV